MLSQRLRRWPNINPALGQCLVLAGYSAHHIDQSDVGTAVT